MEKTASYKFSLRKKLALFITILALITYSTSAFFIYVLYPLLPGIGISAFVFNLITLTLGVLWSGFLAFLAAGFIIKPLQRLEKSAIKAAHGNLSEDVKLSSSDDEIRSLGMAYNDMLSNLREMVKSIEKNFNSTNATVKTITGKSQEAQEQTDSITRAVEEIAGGSEVAANSVQATAEAVEQSMNIAQTVQETADHTQAISNEMLSNLDETNKVVHSLVAGLKQLAEENSRSLSSVKSLEENAAKIGDILKLVGTIATQTNLLALNASIEAARAGEHGKGFAVVAEEVRVLADESAKAVDGVAELIDSMQSEVRNVAVQIKKQVQSANAEAEQGVRTNATLQEMTAIVKQMADSTKHITQQVHQQMEQIEHTSRQSQEVAAIAEETSAGTQQVMIIAENQAKIINEVDMLTLELQEQAEQLKETITRFKV
ncbi:HAMP domain-containing methyl-accepting chemotaxis protein [Niallia taxi]|uniref:methyl-accepting chemotaxis protein n=1 Tax=Niallia taxi TaxID=2499688 RepID=UPI002E1DEFD0|nr:HAMP domain-containing methyl-accepting chemotaxis protein [Niallia taxi]